ncbi:MAG: hypothetical protein ABIR08_09015 [Sphingomonas sp.]
MRVLSAIACSSLAIATPAFADLTANYVGPNGFISIKIEVASNRDVRGATSNPNAYFITHDGHGYMIQASFDGPAVMRIEDMSLVMQEQMKKLTATMPKDAAKNVPTMELVKGGVVTIRGRKGIAYYMSTQAGGKPVGPPFVVISSDPTLAPLGAAMAYQFDMSVAAMGQFFAGTNPFKSVQDVLKTGAPLVFTGFELDTVTDEPIPAARFALPAPALSLEGVRKNMGASAP